MAATIDNREALAGKASVHALIVGVSEYGPHLPPADAPRPPADGPAFGMRSLTTPAASAAAVFNWLIANQSHLPQPLGTCRLLLAPSEAERPRLDLPSGTHWETATRSAFKAAAEVWRNDASGRAGNITFFYFAGHGVQRKHNDHVLLFPGFGSPSEPDLNEGVSVDEIVVGMGPSDDRKQVAKRQLYFIDACRDRVDNFDKQERNTVPQLWRIPKLNSEYRDAVVFRTTAYGSPAYSIPGDITVFARALIDCLGGLAGVNDTGQYDPDTYEPTWWVTATSLNDALNVRVPAVSAAHGLPPQQVEPSGPMSNILIVRLPGPPVFPVILRMVPPGADKVAALMVCDDDGHCVKRYVQPFDQHPIADEFPGGLYKVSSLDESPPLHPKGKPKSFASKSPSCEWRIRFAVDTASDPKALGNSPTQPNPDVPE